MSVADTDGVLPDRHSLFFHRKQRPKFVPIPEVSQDCSKPVLVLLFFLVSDWSRVGRMILANDMEEKVR